MKDYLKRVSVHRQMIHVYKYWAFSGWELPSCVGGLKLIMSGKVLCPVESLL